MANPNEQEKAMRTKVKWKRFTEMEVDMIMPDPSPNGNIYHSAFEMNAARNGLTVPPKARAIFGYLVIMLYKNVNESNFREFSNKRFKALRAVAHDISDGHISVFNDVEDAICYRNSYGQNHQIRKAVLSAVLGSKKNDHCYFSSVSLNVAKFLSWTDMAGYYVVEENLVYPDSPVLKAPELAIGKKQIKQSRKLTRLSITGSCMRILRAALYLEEQTFRRSLLSQRS
ncbi:unnamed protein product [Arabidopsis thaliana]|uniref:Uncharacterized protein n=1 Tax=Arabidopsis thaliana TaxID=3702 RepID=A0A5S9XZS1_ARATH|nr:unnamed protein product [Arabidopsis thaliana]